VLEDVVEPVTETTAFTTTKSRWSGKGSGPIEQLQVEFQLAYGITVGHWRPGPEAPDRDRPRPRAAAAARPSLGPGRRCAVTVAQVQMARRALSLRLPWNPPAWPWRGVGLGVPVSPRRPECRHASDKSRSESTGAYTQTAGQPKGLSARRRRLAAAAASAGLPVTGSLSPQLEIRVPGGHGDHHDQLD
jgi:hypothetical protein